MKALPSIGVAIGVAYGIEPGPSPGKHKAGTPIAKAALQGGSHHGAFIVSGDVGITKMQDTDFARA
jgi:hypothetical protein